MTGPSKEYAVIWRAIRERERVTFVHDGKFRELYPVILGYSAEGREALMGYQYGGQTSPGKRLPGWRCFRLADVHDVTSRKQGWLEGGSHKRAQACVQFVDVDVNIAETLTRRKPLPFGSPELRSPRRGD